MAQPGAREQGQCYKGTWKEGTPKCGEFFDLDRTAPAAPEAAVPSLQLGDAEGVLAKARAELGLTPASS
jgi:hypothetical protein